jgi:transposase
MEQLDNDLLFRWFVCIGVDDPAWDHSVFSKNRDRLLEGDIAAKFLSAVDGTLIEVWASMKSVKPNGGSGKPQVVGGGRNAEVHVPA